MLRMKPYVSNMIGNSVKARIFFIASFLFVLVICFLMVQHVWIQSSDETKEMGLKMASIAEAGLSKENVKKLDINESDLSKPEYNELKRCLTNIIAAHKTARFAYILVVRNGKINFAADSEPADSKDYSPPGQEYSELSTAAYRPFGDGKPLILHNKDRWGKWVTIMIPMRDPVAGEVIALYCEDYAEGGWDRYAIYDTAEAALIALCVILLYFAGLIVVRINLSISQEKKKLADANAKLRKEEQLFRTVYEQSPVGISINCGGVEEYNSMYEKIVGRTTEEIYASGWENFTHPDDLPVEMEIYKQFLSGEIPGFTMNKRYIKPNGDIVWVNITLTPLIMDIGSEFDYLCIVEDMTDRVKAEKELLENERSFSVLLSNLPGMAYRCKYDKEWTMLFVSEGSYDLTGYPSASLINNKDISFKELISSKYRDYLWEKWNYTVTNHTKLEEEYEILTASGEVRWVFEQGQAIYDVSGNVEALEGLIIDITDRKRKEDENIYLNNHDFLTGIYNRRFFESVKERLDRPDFLPLSVMIGDINGVKLVNDALGHAEGDILIAETAKIIQSCCREDDIAARTGGDEFVILMPFTDSETANEIMANIRKKCEEYNKDLTSEAYAINISLGYATKISQDEHLDGTIKLAEEFMYKRKLLEHKSSHSVILSSIKATMHERSHETQEHAERLTNLSKELGKKMKLSQLEMDELELVATLHDIGKVGVDDRILNKPDRLDEIEWIEMKKHSEIGYRIAMSSPDLVAIADYILCHHEHWDGGGYPQGLKGEEIPLLSRIVSVVDAFDAMTEDRTYRKAMLESEAVREIRNNMGTQFDPKIARIFLDKVLPSFHGGRK